jgi:hypothetical protein
MLTLSGSYQNCQNKAVSNQLIDGGEGGGYVGAVSEIVQRGTTGQIRDWR